MAGNSNSLASIAAATTESTFAAAANTSYNGKWGYKPSKLNSVANTNYLPSPTTTATTLDETSTANATPNIYTISVGARADYIKPAADYSNTINAVSNPIIYTISYNKNTTDTVTGIPATQSNYASSTNIVLSSNTPARENYIFVGWCNIATTNLYGADTCTGEGAERFYPGGNYGIDQTTSNIVTLRAMWISSYMQDMTDAACSIYAADAPLTLLDRRQYAGYPTGDYADYTVRYIADRCWMTQNLRVTPETALTPTDSNVPVSLTMSAEILTNFGSGSGTGNTAPGVHIPTSSDLNTINNTVAPDLTLEQVGAWYNYCAATAQTVCTDGSTMGNNPSQYDICPKGWRLPTNTEQNTITGTVTAGGINNASKFMPVQGGRLDTGGLFNTDTGRWWSSTAYSASNRYRMILTGSSLSANTSDNRYCGLYVRCVRNNAAPAATITFNANGGIGTMNNQIIENGTAANLASNTFTRTDYLFVGWNTAANGFQSQSAVGGW